jgi:hypothetical protein
MLHALLTGEPRWSVSPGMDLSCPLEKLCALSKYYKNRLHWWRTACTWRKFVEKFTKAKLPPVTLKNGSETSRLEEGSSRDGSPLSYLVMMVHLSVFSENPEPQGKLITVLGPRNGPPIHHGTRRNMSLAILYLRVLVHTAA